MSENAKEQCEEWFSSYEVLEENKREVTVRETQMMARALALQQTGIIPMHTDPDWIQESMLSVPRDSLR